MNQLLLQSLDIDPKQINYIIIDSKYRTNGDTSSFIVQFKKGIIIKKFIQLQSANIPISYYNLKEDQILYVRYFNSTEGGLIEKQVTIPNNKNYTIDSIIQYLNDAQITVGIMIHQYYLIFAYDISSLKINVTTKHTVSGQLNALPIGLSFKASDNLSNLLGIRKTSEISKVVPSLPYQFEKCINFSVDNYIYLKLSNIKIKGLQLNNQEYNDKFTIYNDKQFGEIVQYKNDQFMNVSFMTDQEYTQFNIQLIDENYQPLKMNDVDWQCTFIYY